MVQGALRVAAEVGPAAGDVARAPLQVLARLHALAAAGLAPERQLGRPAPGGRGPARRRWPLLTSPTTARRSSSRAVVHGELATMGAFPVGAGVVARGAARLTVVTRGLDPTAVSVPEVGHVELGRDAYLAALAGYAAGGAGRRRGLAACTAPRRSCSAPAKASRSARRSSAAPDRPLTRSAASRRQRAAPRDGTPLRARQTGLPGVHRVSGDQDKPGRRPVHGQVAAWVPSCRAVSASV